MESMKACSLALLITIPTAKRTFPTEFIRQILLAESSCCTRIPNFLEALCFQIAEHDCTVIIMATRHDTAIPKHHNRVPRTRAVTFVSRAIEFTQILNVGIIKVPTTESDDHSPIHPYLAAV